MFVCLKSFCKVFLVSFLASNIVFAADGSLPADGLLSAPASSFISLEGAYVRGLPPSVKNTSAYMVIHNSSDEEFVLTGARSDIAMSITIHQTTNDHGMMNMGHVMSISIPAHGQAVLESGATHLMIMGLKSALIPGGLVNIVLEFENGLAYSATMPVRSVLDE